MAQPLPSSLSLALQRAPPRLLDYLFGAAGHVGARVVSAVRRSALLRVLAHVLARAKRIALPSGLSPRQSDCRIRACTRTRTRTRAHA